MNKWLYIKTQLFLALLFVVAVASIIIILIKGNTLFLAISGWALVAILAIAGFLLSLLFYLSGAMKQSQEAERNKWIGNLKIGDDVILESTEYKGESTITKVEGITRLRQDVVVEGKIFYKENGRQRSSAPNYFLTEATEERKESILDYQQEEEARSILREFFSSGKTLEPESLLQELADLIYPEVKNK